MSSFRVDAPQRRPSTGRASLWPKEHGAYAMLLFPLATALIFARLAAASVALGVALLAAFMAHEPMLILLGRRGPRALRQLGGAARPRLVALTAMAAVAGVLGLWLAPAARLWAVPPLVLALVVGALMTGGYERTVTGEIFVSAAFACASLPIGAAGGVDSERLVAMACIWFATFSLEALAVKATLSRLKGGRPLLRLSAFVLPLGLFAFSMAPLVSDSPHMIPHIALALAPACVASLVLGLAHIHPRKLRIVGWALVSTDCAVLVALLAA